MMDIIQLDHVSKRFAHKILFDDVILRISEGTIVGFKGANGCGKSVLFKIISGLYRPDSGDVYVRGKKIGDDFDYPPDMGIFINAPGFIPVYSGFKNLKCLADIRGKIDSKKICAAMDKVGLNPNDKTPVKNYSLGMKQKLGIAQAFMEDQSILLLDEPFNALDQESHLQMLDCLRELRNLGKTILITSHNADDLDTLCNTTYLIQDSKIFPVN